MRDKIGSNKARIAVLGLGYVGLPLAISFADRGFPVFGIDTDVEKIKLLKSKGSGIDNNNASLPVTKNINEQDILVDFTDDFSVLLGSDVVIICVPTPLSKTGEPDLTFIISAADQIAKYSHSNMLVVLESTTYPGATEDLLLPTLLGDRMDKYRLGSEFFVAFSPERIDPGREDWTLTNTPKVVGGVTEGCREMAELLYSKIVDSVVTVSDTTTAEMVKLLENTFRATNIALANELAIMCERLEVSVWEVIDAAKTKPFGFMPFYPGPGLGGHCIPVDPRYLSWRMRWLNYEAKFIKIAEEINSSMPLFVVNKTKRALDSKGKNLRNSSVLILGVTYKPNVADIRESPALEILELFLDGGGVVKYHDPFVPEIKVDRYPALQSCVLSEQILKSCDALIIVSNHDSYDLQFIGSHCDLLIDTRNSTQGLILDCEVVKL